MKKLSSLLFLITLYAGVAMAQTVVSKKAVCGKKWHGVKYEDADGKSHTIPAEEVNNYIVYGCDGKFTSAESGKVISGIWKMDKKNSTITTTQSQTAPGTISITKQIVSVDKDRMVIRAREADGSYRTVYFEVMN